MDAVALGNSHVVSSCCLRFSMVLFTSRRAWELDGFEVLSFAACCSSVAAVTCELLRDCFSDTFWPFRFTGDKPWCQSWSRIWKEVLCVSMNLGQYSLGRNIRGFAFRVFILPLLCFALSWFGSWACSESSCGLSQRCLYLVVGEGLPVSELLNAELFSGYKIWSAMGRQW